MNQILYNTSKSSLKTKLLIILLIVFIGLIVCLSTIFSLTNRDNEAIIKNVFISGLDVSNKTKDEAKKIIEKNVEDYQDRKVKLVLDKQEYRVSASEMGFEMTNLDRVLDEAYAYGRDENFVKNNYTILFSNFKNKDIELEYGLDDDIFNDYVDRIISLNESIILDDTYTIEDNKLIIRKGQDGKKIDKENLKELVLAAITGNIARVDVPVVEAESEKLNLSKVYEEVSIKPENARIVSGEKFEIIQEKNGYKFSLDEAKELYNNHEGSGDIVIDLEVVEASIKVEDLDEELYAQTISTYSTPYDESDTSRVKNLVTSTSRCNNVVVMPGEVFSFHQTIGTRTIANGYAMGNSYIGGRVIKTVGGGICQVSSTLYNVVLKADMEIVERKPHGMLVAYAEPSLDATISEGTIDFRFKNTRKYPIKIYAVAENGIVTVSILGLKDPDEPTIELKSIVNETIPYKTIEQNNPSMMKGTTNVIQSPMDGCVSEAHLIKKDKDGNVILESFISSERYAPINEIIDVGTKENTPPPAVIPPDVVEPVIDENPNDVEVQLPPGWDSPENPYAR